ncbi:helix-turn-helix transcriptional regulator [Enterobacter ludwigii]|jgi:HTH-type transcriptional regulator/antitoxin HipB|nr:helix-turn-helix transcriptional regulator [Enterobacter ludwigii]
MKNVYTLRIINHLHPLLVGFRKSKGLTQKEVSERLGVTQQTYARLEANPSTASIARLFKVLTVLGVDINLTWESCTSTIEKTEINNNFENSPSRREKW